MLQRGGIRQRAEESLPSVDAHPDLEIGVEAAIGEVAVISYSVTIDGLIVGGRLAHSS